MLNQSIYQIKVAIKVTFKGGLSPSKKSLFYLLQWKDFKNDEKCFLFHPRNSFCSQDIWILVLTFWSCRKTVWLER